MTGRFQSIRLALLVLVSLSGAACGSRTTPFRSAMTAAEEARRDGRFDQERDHFEEAAARAKKPKDAGEARYRRAHSFVREGRYETGAQKLEAFAQAHPQAIRAARAWLDAGRAWEKAEQNQQALGAFRTVVRRYPESGNAIAAAQRIVALSHETEGLAEESVWRALLEENKSASLDEALRYNYARSLEARSRKDAILTYEDVARRHPLPDGSYTDEALLRSAELRRDEGDPKGALETIELLLEQGGAAAFVGSYTRTAYIEALLLKGRILRDDLEQFDKARETFESLPKNYPHSRLIDDALWESIITMRLQGESGCEGFKMLKKNAPESRFLRCEKFLCQPSSPTRAGGLEPNNNDPQSTNATLTQELKCSRWLTDF